MSKISIEDMEYTVRVMGDEYVIFAMLDFNHWDLDSNGFMWSVMCHNIKKNHMGKFLLHPGDYRLERPILSNEMHDVANFDEARNGMCDAVETIEDLLQRGYGTKEKSNEH